MKEVYIVSAVRTPIGKYGGVLTPFSGVQLATLSIEAALTRAKLSADHIEEVYLGNVLQANLGQAPARQAALAAGIPSSVPCTTVNKVCSSGMKSIALGASSIRLGENNIVLVGGFESMSNVPYYTDAKDIRIHNRASTMGHKKQIDGMLKDGLWDVYSNQHMGNCAEICADTYGFSRKQQDDCAVESFRRAQNATQNGLFKDEIVPIRLPAKRGAKKDSGKLITEDEGTRFNDAKLRALRPAFKRKGGSVTAGNASQLSDGAAALILASAEAVKKYNLKPLAKILSYADAAKAPTEFTTAPALAVPKALRNAGLKVSDLGSDDYFELNEAFAVVSLANAKLLSLEQSQINIFGGAVALGHPLGCSGARIVVTLLNALRQKNGRLGVAGICNGGGGASAMVIQSCEWSGDNVSRSVASKL